MIRANEFTSEDISVQGNGPVKAFDMNSLRSNNPIEDSHNEAVVRPPGSGPHSDPTTMLFGVFDGHGGAACGQVKCYYCFNSVRIIFDDEKAGGRIVWFILVYITRFSNKKLV